MGVFRTKIRPVRGTRVRTAKLKEADILGIRFWHKQGESLQFIADCYSAYRGVKISKQQIHRIVKGQDWKWVLPQEQGARVNADAQVEKRAVVNEGAEEPTDVIGFVL